MGGGPPYVFGYGATGDLRAHTPGPVDPALFCLQRSHSCGSLTRRSACIIGAVWSVWSSSWWCENLTLSHPEPNKQSVLRVFVGPSTVTFS